MHCAFNIQFVLTTSWKQSKNKQAVNGKKQIASCAISSFFSMSYSCLLLTYNGTFPIYPLENDFLSKPLTFGSKTNGSVSHPSAGTIKLETVMDETISLQQKPGTLEAWISFRAGSF